MVKTEATARIKIDEPLKTVDCDLLVVGDVFAASRVALRVQDAATLGLPDAEV
jgi:hypothetical protein